MHVDTQELARPDALLRRLAQELGLAEEGQHGLIVHGFLPDPRETKPTVTVVTI